MHWLSKLEFVTKVNAFLLSGMSISQWMLIHISTVAHVSQGNANTISRKRFVSSWRREYSRIVSRESQGDTWRKGACSRIWRKSFASWESTSLTQLIKFAVQVFYIEMFLLHIYFKYRCWNSNEPSYGLSVYDQVRPLSWHFLGISQGPPFTVKDMP